MNITGVVEQIDFTRTIVRHACCFEKLESARFGPDMGHLSDTAPGAGLTLTYPSASPTRCVPTHALLSSREQGSSRALRD